MSRHNTTFRRRHAAWPVDSSIRIGSMGRFQTCRFPNPSSTRAIRTFTINTGISRFVAGGRATIFPVDSATHPLLSRFVRQTNATGGSNVSFTTQTYNLEAQHSLELSSSNRLSYGINYRYNMVDGAAVSELGREDRLGFHLQDEWKLLSPLTLVAGSVMTSILASMVPGARRVALIYSLTPEHTFRISGSVAYRPPTLFESNLDLRISPTTPPLFASHSALRFAETPTPSRLFLMRPAIRAGG